MKSSRQQIEKVSEVSQQHNKDTGIAVKKSIKRTAGGYQKAAPEVKITSAAPQNIPRKRIYFTERTGRVEADEHPAKVKLQLFPLTESMQLGLEKDGYNPFLELTLSVRKKISSVIKHLNTKWGSSGAVNGEMMLFPYNTRLENLASCGRWTQNNSDITAGEVHRAIGSPTVFRLRYGWISSLQLESVGVSQLCSHFETVESEKNREGCKVFSDSRYGKLEKLKVVRKEFKKSININEAPEDKLPSDAASDHMGDDCPVHTLALWDDLTNLSVGGVLSEASLKSKRKDSDWCTEVDTGDVGLQPIPLDSGTSIGGLLSEASLHGNNQNGDLPFNTKKLGLETNMEKSLPQSQFSWDDNLTTLSIGGLLSEVSLQGKMYKFDPKLSGSKLSSQEALHIYNSFDAFVAAELNSSPLVSPLPRNSHSSILDAEETCHAFSFGKFSSLSKDLSSSSGVSSNNYSSTKPFKFPKTIEHNGESLPAQDPFQQPKEIPSSRPKGVYDEDSSLGLSGIKWNDTLGPFDLGLPTSRPVLSGSDSIGISEIVR